MITLSTPADILRKELLEDERKAYFWLKKYYHGEKGYEKKRDAMIEECQRKKETVISDIVEYISPKGNRWMVFECARYYKDARFVNTVPCAFCYYETYGSVGTFMVGRHIYSGQDETIIHFTNHFFLRFCQRLGVEMRSRWMVQRFVEVIPGFLFGYNGKDKYGRYKYDVRLPGSIGRGVLTKGVIEIRTYLTDKELNGKQLRETEKLRECYERQTFEPMDARMVRLIRSNDFDGDLTREIDNVAESTGLDRGTLIFSTNIRIFITLAIADLGYIRNDDLVAWRDLGVRTRRVDLFRFAENYGNSEDKAKEMYDIICEFGRLSGIKGFDAKKVMEKTIEIWEERVRNEEKDL